MVVASIVSSPNVILHFTNNCLPSCVLSLGFEWMVEAGTIKSADIPTVLVDKYSKKSGKKNK